MSAKKPEKGIISTLCIINLVVCPILIISIFSLIPFGSAAWWMISLFSVYSIIMGILFLVNGEDVPQALLIGILMLVGLIIITSIIACVSCALVLINGEKKKVKKDLTVEPFDDRIQTLEAELKELRTKALEKEIDKLISEASHPKNSAE